MHIKNILLAICLFFGIQTQAQTSYIIPDGKSEEAGYLHFRENLGQVQNDSLDSVPEIKYYCTQMESKLWIQEDGIISWTALKETTDSLPDTLYRIDMQPYWEGSPIVSDAIVAEESTGATSNYYLPHCGINGIEDVGHYQRITHTNIYPNIHQQVYSNTTGYKYYYIVEPGGHPNDINIVFSGQDLITVTPTKMNFYVGQMALTLDNAIAYEIDGSNQVVPLTWTPTFNQQGNGSVTFGTGSYNTSNTLVIQVGSPAAPAVAAANPGSMEYSSYLTSDKNDKIKKVTTNSTGHIYMLGESESSRFSFSNGIRAIQGNAGGNDAVVFKFNSIMKPLAYAYYGSASDDAANGMVLASNGNVYFAGSASGASLTKASNTKPSGPAYYSGYVASLDINLKNPSAVWFGSDGVTNINDIGIGSNNKLIIAGRATVVVGNLPVTKLGSTAYYQNTIHSTAGGFDGFVAQLSSSFSVEHCTWFGDDANNEFHKLSIDNSGNIYALMFTGKPANRPPSIGCNVHSNKSMPKCLFYNPGYFSDDDRGANDYYLAQFNSNFRLDWSTWIGSSGAEGDAEMDLVVDKANPTVLYLALSTDNPSSFPQSSASSGYIVNRTTDNRNVMVLKFVSGILSWHTALGCTGNRTGGLALEMDNKENVFVSGYTRCRYIPLPGGWCSVPGQSIIFPMCDNNTDLFVQSKQYFDGQNAPSILGFVTAFDKNNLLKWSTWFGGSGSDQINSLHFNATQERMYSVGTSFSNVTPIPLRKITTPGSHFQGTLASAKGGMVSWFDSDLNFVTVQEIKAENWNLKAYPNPTRSWLHVELEGVASYQLHDISGRLLQSGKFTQEVKALSVGKLASGSYVLRIVQNGKFATVKFVKE